MIDPRLDPTTVSKMTLLIVKIIEEQCPINHGGILKQLPSTVESAYLSTLLKKLRDYGIIRMERKGHGGKFVWVFLPPTASAKPVFRDVGEGKKRTAERVTKAHTLRDMGLYRVRTVDGVQHDRMTFRRSTLTWYDKRRELTMHDITHVAYIPDHAAFKSGVKHLDLYAYPFVDVGKCIIPKLKVAEDDGPKWVNPIRARLISAKADLKASKTQLEPLKKDFGSPLA